MVILSIVNQIMQIVKKILVTQIFTVCFLFCNERVCTYDFVVTNI